MDNQDIFKEILSYTDNSTLSSFSLTSHFNLNLTLENHTWKLRTIQRYGQKMVDLKDANNEHWIHRHLACNTYWKDLIQRMQDMHYQDYYNLLDIAPIFTCRILNSSNEIKEKLTLYLNSPDIHVENWHSEVYIILNKYAKDMNMKRGDIMSLLDFFDDNHNFESDGGRNDNNYDLFYNGTELISPGYNGHYYTIPSEFQVCAEFPIHHWNEWQMWNKKVYFDFTKFLIKPDPKNIIEVKLDYGEESIITECIKVPAYKFQSTPSFIGIEYTHLIVSCEQISTTYFIEKLTDSKEFEIYEYPDGKEFYPGFTIILPNGIHPSQVMII